MNVNLMYLNPPDLSCKRGACASHRARQTDPAPPAMIGRVQGCPFSTFSDPFKLGAKALVKNLGKQFLGLVDDPHTSSQSTRKRMRGSSDNTAGWSPLRPLHRQPAILIEIIELVILYATRNFCGRLPLLLRTSRLQFSRQQTGITNS